jgi:hypothetical protein
MERGRSHPREIDEARLAAWARGRAARLAAFNARERKDSAELAPIETAEARVALALELSELAREIGVAAGAVWLDADDLGEKARLWALPLQLSKRTKP